MKAVEYDIDLAKASEDDILELGKRIAIDNVLIVRNQDLTKEQMVRVARTIGETVKPGQFMNDPNYPDLCRVTNERDDEGEKIGIFADGELGWHSNGNARDAGKESCVALYCVRPGIDSVTSFCDTRQAYADLPDDMKELLLKVDGKFKFMNNTFYNLEKGDKELRMYTLHPVFRRGVEKPLVYTHPYTKEQGIYFTYNYIVDLWNRETGENCMYLVDKLMDHVFQDKYIYHHSDWRPGDFIFMDQWHSLHKRNEVKGDRFLWRLAFDYENCYDTSH
jgi:alpha-ketoglutarate-dependent taurine dioxygenase